MVNKGFRIFGLCISLLCTVLFELHTVYGFQTAPIELKALEYSNQPGCRNVTVVYTSGEVLNTLWTTEIGFNIKDISDKVLTTDNQSHGGKMTSVCVPVEMQMDSVFLHLFCEKHAFELHLNLKLLQSPAEVHEVLKQPLLLVPASNEIGISPLGEARFPVMVDTSGTNFSFGILQTEVTVFNGATVKNHIAYSFYPPNMSSRRNLVSMRKISDDGHEYHADISIVSRDLKESDTIVSVSSACTITGGSLKRLDMMRSLHLPAHVTSTNKQLVAFVSTGTSDTLKLTGSSNALLKCKAIGIPVPNISIYKKTNSTLVPYNAPSYTRVAHFQRTSAFQLLNVTSSDQYVCKATNGESSADRLITLREDPFV